MSKNRLGHRPNHLRQTDLNTTPNLPRR
jgi:hypothetical protein